MDYISKNEALELLQLTSYRQLKRIVDANKVKTKSLGIGKATLYDRTDICNSVVQTKDTKKFAPKKPQVKAKAKKVEKETKAKELNQKKKEVEQVSFNPLNEIGTQEKLRVELELESKGLFMQLDQSLLLSYAIAYQNYMFYINLSSTLSHTLIDDNGSEKVHPYFTVADKCFNQMEKLSKVLGIGARNRIGLEIKTPKTGMMADILSKRNKR